MQSCFLSSVFRLLLTQPCVLTSPSPSPPRALPGLSLTDLCPPTNALLSAELERLPTASLHPCCLTWRSCHPPVHPTMPCPCFRALSSVRPSLVPKEGGPFPRGPSHTLPPCHGPSAGNCFLQMGFIFFLRGKSLRRGLWLSQCHIPWHLACGMGRAGPCRCSLALSLSHLGIAQQDAGHHFGLLSPPCAFLSGSLPE